MDRITALVSQRSLPALLSTSACNDALVRTVSIKKENEEGTIDYLDIEDFGSEEMALEDFDQDRFPVVVC